MSKGPSSPTVLPATLASNTSANSRSVTSPQSASSKVVLASQLRSNTDSPHRKLDGVPEPGDRQLLLLPCGGQISYARLGRFKEMWPVWVIFVGTPGCRLDIYAYHRYAERHRIRIICVDRPGYGYSTVDKKRGILDHIKDVEYLLNFLGIGESKVLGVSGGGPYALAAAYHFSPKRVLKTSIMCDSTHPDFPKISTRILWRFQNWLFRFSLGFYKSTYPFDATALRNLVEAKGDTREQLQVLAVWREQRRQGSAGYALDLKKLNEDWGFALQDMQANAIRRYHGTLDSNCDADAARKTTDRLRQSGTPIEYVEVMGADHRRIRNDKFDENVEWLSS